MKTLLRDLPSNQIAAPSGDWFKVVEERHPGGIRCVMSRVVLWRFSEDHVVGYDSCGHGNDDPMHCNYYYVNGDDLCPNGTPWAQVFDEAPAFHWGLKEIPPELRSAGRYGGHTQTTSAPQRRSPAAPPEPSGYDEYDPRFEDQRPVPRWRASR